MICLADLPDFEADEELISLSDVARWPEPLPWHDLDDRLLNPWGWQT